MVSFGTLEREERFKNPPKDESAYPMLKAAVAPHIGSFNALTEGPGGGLLNLGVKDIGSKTAFDSKDPERLGNKIKFRVESVQLLKPTVSDKDKLTVKREVYPAECRERMVSYRSRMIMKFVYSVNDGPEQAIERDAGLVPIMLGSNRCRLENMSPAQLVAANEESEELGGYFVVNGLEKLIRMLIVQRRNHPMAIIRPSFVNRGAQYSKYGIQIRSVRPDQTSQTNVLHYLNDGNVTFRFSWRKSEYLVPVMMVLKALVETNDREIFDGIVGTEKTNSFLTDRLELLLRTYQSNYHLYGKQETLQFLGDKFRVVMNATPDVSDIDVGKDVLRRIVLVHLKDNKDKFRMLMFMVRKLYALVAGECAPDNPDSAQHQEILLGGFLYGMIIKEKIDEFLQSFKQQIAIDVSRENAVNFTDDKYIYRTLDKSSETIGHKLQYFLATGNLVSNTGLDLQQVSGYTVVAEKINFHRFIAHFRMVHRGSFFAQLKTTTVRKLLPESWGFLCPVHTPDGSPCGLLNHLAHKCVVATSNADVSHLPQALRSLGVSSADSLPSGSHSSCVQLDGQIIGYCSHANAKRVADSLRLWKVEGGHNIPAELEIGYVPPSKNGQYPGLYLFSQQARMVRPVRYLPLDKEDWVGPFEQVYMNVAVTPDEIESNVHTHVEYSPTNIFSILANMTPFSESNQSPRNMYQCQMGKQTMGTPGTALACRSDNKMYQLQTGQAPIVRTGLYDAYGLDEFPNGTNAIVAVIAYTGYDMDDAMIVNKSAKERGFAHGSVFKVEKVDLSAKRRKGEPITQHIGFGTDSWDPKWRNTLDVDGLPTIGVKLNEGDPMLAYYDETLGKTKVKLYKSTEPAHVHEVKLLGDDGDKEFQALTIKLRVNRSPTIGDKFASRHGQKGVCSQQVPTIDMPFSEDGIQPDIIINPHAFPSRMTIGMFIESLAGKSGALHGMAQDCTPFQFTEEYTAAEYFGDQLLAAGYSYHGDEPMYSGVTGEELRSTIFVGPIHYQRLRHMVNDKASVRGSSGPVVKNTLQPVHGRRRGGGPRFGEMERDALIGHGTSYLMQDRLLNCSDYSKANLCKDCGSMINTQTSVPRVGSTAGVRCRLCATSIDSHHHQASASSDSVWEDGQGNKFTGGDNVATVAIPFVLRYLDSELCAMGIKMRFNSSPQ